MNGITSHNGLAALVGNRSAIVGVIGLSDGCVINSVSISMSKSDMSRLV